MLEIIIPTITANTESITFNHDGSGDGLINISTNVNTTVLYTVNPEYFNVEYMGIETFEMSGKTVYVHMYNVTPVITMSNSNISDTLTFHYTYKGRYCSKDVQCQINKIPDN